jgi:hypothetical protein
MVRLGKAILRSLVFIAFPVVQALFENRLMIYEFAPPQRRRGREGLAEMRKRDKEEKKERKIDFLSLFLLLFSLRVLRALCASAVS